MQGTAHRPDRYHHNFVEAFEIGRDRRDGLKRTAEILGIHGDELARARYQDHRHVGSPTYVVGDLSHVGASLESVAGSDLTIYANADPERTFVYFYTRGFLLGAVREGVLRGGLRRGWGSNQDTFGVLVPMSPARWRRVDGEWHFIGEGRPPVARIRGAFTCPS